MIVNRKYPISRAILEIKENKNKEDTMLSSISLTPLFLTRQMIDRWYCNTFPNSFANLLGLVTNHVR